MQIVGISVDPPDTSRQHAKKMGYTFPLLSDTNAAAIKRYDVLHRGAGPKGEDIARPAEFYVDSSGTVRWVNLTENIAVRARPEPDPVVPEIGVRARLTEGSNVTTG